MGSDEREGGAGTRAVAHIQSSLVRSGLLGLQRATPLAVSSGLLGILYGASCWSLGISPGLAALSSVLVFSGAAQFAVLGMLTEPLSALTIAVSSLLVCNRLVLMGMSIAEHVRERSWVARLLSMTLLTDGAWAATVSERAPVDRFVFFVAAGAWILALWVLGTLMGALLAGQLGQETVASLRFSGVLFVTLLLLLVVSKTSMGHLPWIASALVSMGGSQFLPLPTAFLAGVSAGALIAWIWAAPRTGDVH